MENERQFERLKAIIKSDKVDFDLFFNCESYCDYIRNSAHNITFDDYGFLCEMFGKECSDDEWNYEKY